MFLSAGFFAAGSGGPVTPLPGGTASSDEPGNGAATAGWRFNSDGTIDIRSHVGWVLGYQTWYGPTQAGIGSGYYLRATVLSGATPDTGTFGTWLVLSAARTFTDTVTGGGANTASLLIEISTAGSDATIVTDSSDNPYVIDVLSEP